MNAGYAKTALRSFRNNKGPEGPLLFFHFSACVRRVGRLDHKSPQQGWIKLLNGLYTRLHH